MAHNPDQPRIPKGFVGAGRFMKVGQALIAAAKDAAHPGDGGRRGRGEPRLAKAGQALTRRDDAVERTFASAAKAAQGAKRPTTPGKGNTLSAASRVLRGGGWDTPPGEPAISPERLRELAGIQHPSPSDVIRASVARHANDGWAGIADVRDDLAAAGITDRAEQDRALRDLLKEPGVRIVPVADNKNLTARDRAGELYIGGEGNHAIRVMPEPGTVADANDIGRTSGQHPPTPDGVMAAYDELKSEDNGYVSLDRLRSRLGGTREEQNRVLLALDDERRIHLDPYPHRGQLPSSAHDAAIRVGGEDKHMLSATTTTHPPKRGSSQFEHLSDDQLLRDLAELNAEAGIFESDAQERGNLGNHERQLFAELQAVREEVRARGLRLPPPTRRFGRRISATQREIPAAAVTPAGGSGGLHHVRGERVTGSESRAELQRIAEAEGVPLRPNGTRQDYAAAINSARFKRENPGITALAEGGAALRTPAGPPTATPAAASGTRPPRRIGVTVDQANGDLVGLSGPQLHALAEREGISVSRSGTRQQLVEEIAYGRANRRRTFGGPVSQGTVSPPRLAKAGAKIASTQSAADLGERLRTATSREQAQQMIAGLSAAQLKDLAVEMKVPVRKGDNKTQLRNGIVARVGVRLDANAIFRSSSAR